LLLCTPFPRTPAVRSARAPGLHKETPLVEGKGMRVANVAAPDLGHDRSIKR